MNILLSQSPWIINCALRNVSETLRVGLRCLYISTWWPFFMALGMWDICRGLADTKQTYRGGLAGHTGFLKMAIATHISAPESRFSCHSVRFTFSFLTLLKVNLQIFANTCSAANKAPFSPRCAWVLCIGNTPKLTHSLTQTLSKFGSPVSWSSLQHTCRPFYITLLLSLAVICDHFL